MCQRRRDIVFDYQMLKQMEELKAMIRKMETQESMIIATMDGRYQYRVLNGVVKYNTLRFFEEEIESIRISLGLEDDYDGE